MYKQTKKYINNVESKII